MYGSMKDHFGEAFMTAPHQTTVVYNWLEGKGANKEAEDLVAGPFDTVLADYLLGSLEYFAAFGEEVLFDTMLSRLG